MRKRRGTGSLAASPVLVGAVAVLVTCIAVMIAVQANSGLPFVPTYDVKAEIPGGSNLVVGNEVRIGGFRVGAVDRIEPSVSETTDGRAVAVIHMKIDKKHGELPSDTELAIRPRSALGLKYVELTPGDSRRTLQPGETLALAQSSKPVELDEFFSTFDDDTRQDQRTAIDGYGTALAGRGESINLAIEDFVPFMRRLEPVMRNLSDDRTELRNLFPELREFAGQVAPVADTYAELFGNMGTSFEALSRHEDALRDTIERAPDTLQAGIESFPVQRPFLRDSGTLAAKLEPVAEEIERSLPVVADAFEAGAPVLDKAPPFYERTENVFRAVDRLTENPSTLLALRDLDRTLEVAAPLLQFVAPYQTVCNYWVYYWTGIGEHVSEPVRGGTVQRTNLKSDNRTQDNRLSSSEAETPVDVPAGEDPH
jgi:virulence factor Mce-like protein